MGTIMEWCWVKYMLLEELEEVQSDREGEEVDVRPGLGARRFGDLTLGHNPLDGVRHSQGDI